MWCVLEKKEVPLKYIKVIINMYDKDVWEM